MGAILFLLSCDNIKTDNAMKEGYGSYDFKNSSKNI